MTKSVHKVNILFAMFIAIFMVPLLSCNGQSTGNSDKDAIKNDPDGIHWISFEEAVKLAEKNPKKIFIDIYTHWCGWCKKMDATTFKEEEVVKFINANFYPVKLNAETRDTIYFRDKEFKYVTEYKANELAISLLSGKMGYPSYVLLDEQFSLLSPAVQSYLTKEDLMPILTFYGNNIYKTKSWEEFSKK